MLFYKTISNYLKQERNLYNHLICRRKERFRQLVELDAPKEIINLEIQLLLQPFHLHVLRNILYKAMMQVSKTREIII
jgi:hypothetical protein